MFNPLDKRIAQLPGGAKRKSWGLLILLAVAPQVLGSLVPRLAVAGDLPQLSFSAAVVEYGGNRLNGLEVSLASSGEFQFRWDGIELENGSHGTGAFHLGGRLVELSLPEDGLRASGSALYQELETDWELDIGEKTSSLCLAADARPLERLAMQSLSIGQDAWVTRGAADACIRYRQPDTAPAAVDFDVAVAGLSFDSPDGLYAGEGLALDFHGELVLGKQTQVRVGGSLEKGQILLDRYYGDFSAAALAFDLLPEFNGANLAATGFEIRDDGALRVEGRLKLGEEPDSWGFHVDALEMRFPDAYGRYVEPVAAAWTLDGLEVTGTVDWNGAISASGIRSGDLEIADLSIVDTRRGRFALTGLNTRLRPGDYGFDSRFDWRGLLLGSINLGSGSALLDSEPGAFALASPVELEVLGGRLRFDRLGYTLPGGPVAGGGSRFVMDASVSGIDMVQLTAAFGWPQFSGRLSGEVPGVHLDDGVLSADGEVRIEVFGGEVLISDLEAERLFGVLPSLSANIRLNDLDLVQLTDTFQFGRIGGRVDGRIDDLRLLDWQPVAFDAWIGTPDRQGRKESISRRAVTNLTNIGGGGATAALASPLMRIFSSFSYRRLGLGCRLDNYVCEVSGITEDGESVLLMEGAGLPKITVRAWNRNVDWPQMVANLTAVSSGATVQVGDAPEP